MRASADLAELRSDFVSSVTHELKTPLTTIRTVAEAFLFGRLANRQEIHEYSQILDQEAKRLVRLVDNLLAYSRVTDVSEVYTFEALAPGDLIDDVLLADDELAHLGGAFLICVDQHRRGGLVVHLAQRRLGLFSRGHGSVSQKR